MALQWGSGAVAAVVRRCNRGSGEVAAVVLAACAHRPHVVRTPCRRGRWQRGDLVEGPVLAGGDAKAGTGSISPPSPLSGGAHGPLLLLVGDEEDNLRSPLATARLPSSSAMSLLLQKTNVQQDLC